MACVPGCARIVCARGRVPGASVGFYLATLLDYLNQAMSIIAAAGSTVLLYVRRSISHCTFGVPNDRKTRKMPTRRTVCPVFISYEKFLFHMKSFYFI